MIEEKSNTSVSDEEIDILIKDLRYQESILDAFTHNPYYSKMQYAYKIINSALLQYDLESLSENYRIKHKSFNCIRRNNPIIGITYYDKNLKWIDIYLPLDKPDYCIKHCAIHEIAHIIEVATKGVSYDSLTFGHSKTFYDICISIDPNYLKLESCNLCLWILELLVCNKIKKEVRKRNE